MALTKATRQLIDKMRELAEKGDWMIVPSHYGATIRLTRTRETPEYHRGDGFGRWPEATYTELMFVTVSGGKVTLGHFPCPWVGRRDTDEPLWYACMLLDAEDPWDVLERRIEIKRARKAARQAAVGQP